jgi:hypothetical protein
MRANKILTENKLLAQNLTLCATSDPYVVPKNKRERERTIYSVP